MFSLFFFFFFLSAVWTLVDSSRTLFSSILPLLMHAGKGLLSVEAYPFYQRDGLPYCIVDITEDITMCINCSNNEDGHGYSVTRENLLGARFLSKVSITKGTVSDWTKPGNSKRPKFKVQTKQKRKKRDKKRFLGAGQSQPFSGTVRH